VEEKITKPIEKAENFPFEEISGKRN